MPAIKKLGDIAPYAAILLAAVGLYYVAAHIVYDAVPGQMGPDRWPKIVIGILIVVCSFEMVRRLVTSNAGGDAAGGVAEVEDDELLPHHQVKPLLVVATVVATVIYLMLLDYGGFFTCTIFYTAALMWAGGFRRPAMVGLIAIGLSLFFSFVFMRLIFVALPLGEGPFAQASLAVMNLLGIH